MPQSWKLGQIWRKHHGTNIPETSWNQHFRETAVVEYQRTMHGMSMGLAFGKRMILAPSGVIMSFEMPELNMAKSLENHGKTFTFFLLLE